ncbi:Hypothetical predicted protein [Marmota monax]|uniref:Uncharacterized protein n=1 Tax=Marmota monax TaxID=9995 RepID=A0A5E4AA16_MARMO|nr:Hypothetical predicted protein [Marmota monax]
MRATEGAQYLISPGDHSTAPEEWILPCTRTRGPGVSYGNESPSASRESWKRVDPRPSNCRDTRGEGRAVSPSSPRPGRRLPTTTRRRQGQSCPTWRARVRRSISPTSRPPSRRPWRLFQDRVSVPKQKNDQSGPAPTPARAHDHLHSPSLVAKARFARETVTSGLSEEAEIPFPLRSRPPRPKRPGE